MKDKKNIIMLSLTIMVILISVGYSIFNTSLTINGTANIASTWNILFTEIKEVDKKGIVTELSTPTVSGTNATFDVDFKLPGDYITYQITVENQGTIDGIIKEIKGSEQGSDAIKFEIEGIKEGDKLPSKRSTTFDVTISYDSNTSEQPNLTDNKLSIGINYIQDTGSNIPSNNPDIVPTRLSQKILYDNKIQSDENINFGAISSETNGKGLYYTNKNTEDNKISYYFRGAVNNNYVSFAGYYWRIIRINEDGSIRLIYQGDSADATGSNAQVGTSAFNSTIGDNSMVGYMHGKPTNNYTDGSGNYSGWAWDSTTGTVKMSLGYTFNPQTGVYTLSEPVVSGTYSETYYGYYTCYSQSTTCTHMIKLTQAKKNGNTYQIWGGETHAGYWSTSYEQAHANEVDSNIKKSLEDWYKDHLLKYDLYIADTGFCNDRSLSTGTGVGRIDTHYGPGARLCYNGAKTPQFACPNLDQDLFTVSNAKGNKKSIQKVGLITADEAVYAGGVYGENNSYYLNTGVAYWTMSPFVFISAGSRANDWVVGATGNLYYTRVWDALGVRPVINLNANIEITDIKQDGTIEKPYIIKTD